MRAKVFSVLLGFPVVAAMLTIMAVGAYFAWAEGFVRLAIYVAAGFIVAFVISAVVTHLADYH